MYNFLINTTTRILPYVFAASLAFVPAPSFADDSESVKLKKAEELLTKGKIKPATVLLREIIRSNPNSAEAHAHLGAALAADAEKDNYDPAIAEEQLALKLDPKSFAAKKTLGKIYANQRKFAESIAVLKEACALKPDSFGAQRDLGTAYLASGNNDEAISSFKQALKIRPSSVEAHVKLAVLLSKKPEYKEAIAEAREAVKLAENQAETHLTLANIMLESGDTKGSIEPFKEAIAKNGYDSLGCLNPLTAASAFSGLGWAISSDKAATKEQMLEGVKNQKKAIKAYPNFLPAYIRQGDLLARLQRNKEAEAVYATGLNMSHGNDSIAIPFAKFLDYTGRNAEACTMLKKVLEKYPDNKKIAETLSELEKHKK